MKENRPRRKMLKVAGMAAGATAGLAILPFVGYTLIHKMTTESGEIVEVSIDKLPPGQLLTVDFQGKPVWILRRTPEMLATLQNTGRLVDPASEHSKQPSYAKNAHRSLKPEIFVAFGICPHLGCAPIGRFRPGADEGMPADWAGGFLCPCHTSTFDFAGRAHVGREAKTNLAVPPYRFLDDGSLRIGDDPPLV
jgi:ubiquinol-cytochrome c reductase iron-sulfur subunit